MTLEPSYVLEVKNLSVYFKVEVKKRVLFSKMGSLKAVDDVSFKLERGKTLGVVGESGCGKTTLTRAILKLNVIKSGSILYNGLDLAKLDNKNFKKYRRDIQIVFQDPLASLNPRMTIGNIIAEPLKNFYPKMSSSQRKKRVVDIMKKVGIAKELINGYPHNFSGGQCQRIGIARALIIEPKLLICDEPVSALDVSIQAQIINLIKDLQKELDLSIVFISHDLSVIKYISDDILVMYLGNAIERSKKEDLYKNPLHPYTKALLSAIPILDPKKQKKRRSILLKDDLPSPIDPPKNCPFSSRCEDVMQICYDKKPFSKEYTKGHEVACFLY